MKFNLSYVNLPDGSTLDCDMEFPSMEALVSYVKDSWPNFSSFQIIVTPEA